MHVRSCCFGYETYCFFFWRSRHRPRRWILQSLLRNSWLAVVLVSESETLYLSIWNHLFCYQESRGRGPRPVWKAASKRCCFGEWIHWSRMDGMPVRVKKYMRLQKYLQSWTKVLGTVLQYSYFSVISRFPLFLAVLASPNLYKVETRKKSGYTRPTLFVGWGERLDLCELENAPETQKCPKTFVHDCRLVWVWPQLDLLQVDLSKVIESERSEFQCMRSPSDRTSDKVWRPPFRLNGFEIYYEFTKGKKWLT